LHPDLLGQRQPELQGRAIDVAAVRLVGAGIDLLAVELDTRGNAGAEKIRLRRRKVDSARVLAVAHGRFQRVAAAEEIAVAELDLGEQAIGGRVTAGNVEIAGRLLVDLDIDDDAVRGRTGHARDLDGLEIVQALKPPLGAVDQILVVASPSAMSNSRRIT